ncbi:MAG: winged helix DNA-binding domain-containing protein [Gammaproteobacteria bacterium]|nr:winged helix DNA-binding domain-containing protein [Gammaproteobacteria bacterium]
MTPQWRFLVLSRQGLTSQQPFGTGLSASRSAIEHLGYVQIDTLSVVERAHHHVLWNRVPDYNLDHLNQLIDKRHIFEYWYHAASYLPMRDYRYALPQMLSIRAGKNRYYNNIDKKIMKEVLARITAEGALRARDFDQDNNSQRKWWGSGPTRRAIDRLFMQGDLMVCSRKGMEKVYDLTERCLPEGIDLSMPSHEEYAAYLFNTTLRAHGIFTWKQLLHLKTGKSLRDAMTKVVNERIEAGVIEAVSCADAPTFYADIKALEQVSIIDTKVKILSPFDNLVIHRERLGSLFKFDYRLECYVAAPKRVFGYFCLPILYGNTLVGRIDCKAHRAEQRFEVLSLHLETSSVDRQQLLLELNPELQKFANFNRCPQLDTRVFEKKYHRCSTVA